MISEKMYDILKTVNANCYPGAVEQEINPPFISHRQLNNDPNPTKDGASGLDVVMWQVGYFAETKNEVETLSESGRTALDEYSDSIYKIRFDGENGTFDEESNLHAQIQNYKIRIKL